MRISRMAGVVVGSLVVLAGIAAQAVPITVTTASGIGGADSFIKGHNYGDETVNFDGGDLRVYNFAYDATDGNSRTYLRFNIPTNGNTMSAADLASSTLTLTVRSATAGFGSTSSRITVAGLNDGYTSAGGGPNDNGDANGVKDLGNNWGETAITWANAPGDVAQWASDVNQYQPANATVLGHADVAWASVGDGSKIVFSGAALANWITTDTDGLLTVFLFDEVLPINTGNWYQGGNSFYFYSKDSTIAVGSVPISSFPTLSLAPLPEPTAAMLLLVGATALGLRRRRT